VVVEVLLLVGIHLVKVEAKKERGQEGHLQENVGDDAKLF
jgi:hypothetical protein